MTRRKKIHQRWMGGDTSQLADSVRDNTKLFNSLINTYLAGPYRTTRRLAGAVTQVVLENPSLLKPHFKRIIDALNDQYASAALKRNTIRMFQFVAVPDNRHGQFIDICFRYLQDKKETIAVKVFAMTVLELLTHHRHELRRELRMIIEDQLPYAGPAFRSRGSKVLRKLTSRA